MVSSKSFGYALQGVLFIAMQGDANKKTQLDEMAEGLNVPRYFLGKIMNRLAKDGIVDSIKGHYGGFKCNESTLSTNLMTIAKITGDTDQLDACILRSRDCNEKKPCPLHNKVEPIKKQWRHLLNTLTIEDLLQGNDKGFLKSISGS